MCNTSGILADRDEIVLHTLDELVDIHSKELFICRSVCSKLLHLLGVFFLMNMGHGGLVDVEDRIHILTRINLVLRFFCICERIVFSTADFILRIVFVDVLVEVLPNERDSFLSFLNGLTAVMGFIEHRVAVGLELAIVTVHGHDKRIDWSNP